MDDLISRETLLNKLKNSFISINYHPDFGDIAEGMASELYNEALADAIRTVEEQPIAYNAKKVVSQLEKEIELVVEQYPLNGKYIKKSRVIDIVEGGGLSD